MAINGSVLTGGQSTSNTSSYSSASVSPSANALILAACVAIEGSGTPPTPTVSGNSLTWEEVASIVFNDLATPISKLSVFRALGASPTSGAVTFDFGGNNQAGCTWGILQFTGINTGGTNGSGAIGDVDTLADDAVTGLTLSLTFASSGNGAFMAFGLDTQNVVTGEDGWTPLNDNAHGTPNSRIATFWRADNDTSPSATWTTSDAGGIAIELISADQGRVTKNTRSFPLGLELGMRRGMAG